MLAKPLLLFAPIVLFASAVIDAREPQKSPPARSTIENKIVRARDLGVPFDGTPDKFDAITDVAGVEVGYTTLIEGEGKLVVGQGPVRTGVTAIFPRGHASNDPVYAGVFSLNGNGEMTGTAWVEESGFLEGPIVITNTHSVGGGTGMICYEFKGGNGTASRKIDMKDKTGAANTATPARSFTVGVFLQANFGRRPQLAIAGVPIGKEIPGEVYKKETG